MEEHNFIAFLFLASFGFTSIAARTPYLENIFIRHFAGDGVHRDEKLANASQLVPHIDDSKPTILYIHGYFESVNSTSVHTVVSAYQDRGDYNVMALDYTDLAILLYPYSVRASEDIGKEVAAALDSMVEAGLRSEEFAIVAHSLGCQVTGFAARNVHFTVERIIGLDPAGPLYNAITPHLVATDAVAVIIIHTDKGWLGNIHASGTVDFYPNCGHRIQPGCPSIGSPLSNEDYCSHHRSWRFFAESLSIEDSFIGIRCDNSTDFTLGKCNQNDKIIMGHATPQNASGAYYLWTAPESPFGVGDNGTVCTDVKCANCHDRFLAYSRRREHNSL